MASLEAANVFVRSPLSLFLLTIAPISFGQVATPKENYYDVVSIKRGEPLVFGCGYHPSPGQLRLDNCSIPYLIANASRVRQDRLLGLPAWTSSETYSFVAKSVIPATPSEQWSMLAAVLQNRFGLTYHRETRQQRVYELFAQANGIRFPESVPGTCTPFDPDAPKPTSPEQMRERSEHTCGSGLSERSLEGGLRLSVKAVTMAQLAIRLEQYLDRPVVDRTGSNLKFDVDLTFDDRALSLPQTEQMPAGNGAARKGGAYSSESGLPNIVAALKKVGVSLTGGQGGVEVLVIDRLERPSEN